MACPSSLFRNGQLLKVRSRFDQDHRGARRAPSSWCPRTSNRKLCALGEAVIGAGLLILRLQPVVRFRVPAQTARRRRAAQRHHQDADAMATLSGTPPNRSTTFQPDIASVRQLVRPVAPATCAHGPEPAQEGMCEQGDGGHCEDRLSEPGERFVDPEREDHSLLQTGQPTAKKDSKPRPSVFLLSGRPERVWGVGSTC